jgi:hypothetical protein
MSWHARRLVDLVDSLAGRFNKRRYDVLAQQLGRSPETYGGRRRGFVIVQIDGLAYDYLVEAMARGHTDWPAGAVGCQAPHPPCRLA